MRTEDVNWQGRQEERGNVVFGWLLREDDELVPFESCADELVMDDCRTWLEFKREMQTR
jgi:hypothetical protein